MLFNGKKTNEELAAEAAELRRQLTAAQAEAQTLRQKNEMLTFLHSNLHKLIHELPIGVQVLDVNGLCLDVNKAHLEIFGLTEASQHIGKFNLFTDILSRQVGTQAAGRRALSGEVVHLPEVVCDFDKMEDEFCPLNEQKTLSVTFVPIRNTRGEVIQLVAFNEDITERRRAEQELRASEELFRQVISSISDHIYVSEVTAAGERINIYLSPHVEAMTGYPHQKFIDDWTFWPNHVIHPEDRVSAAAQARLWPMAKTAKWNTGWCGLTVR